MAEDLLVIQGGKLIDGTGRRPIEDSVIVMKAGKFKAIGRRGEIPTYSDMHVVFKYRNVFFVSQIGELLIGSSG
jgi:hypothetical protein